MKKQTISAIAAALFLTASSSFGQDNASKVQSKVDSAHLVGHEDELLLKRIEDAIAEWDPRNLDSPYLKTIQTKYGKSYALRRPDLAEFIADPDAAVALGKTLFWEMKAGSDFGDHVGKMYGTACASCHYRFGADARSRNTETIAFQAWDKFASERGITDVVAIRKKSLPFTSIGVEFKPSGATEISKAKFSDVDTGLLPYEIVGSQGVVLRKFKGLQNGTELFGELKLPTKNFQSHDMFKLNETTRTRQVTGRNSPSVINSVFNNRQFHDGRAESTFNGFSIFGDFDKRVILKKANLDPSGKAESYEPVSIAIVNASLASQAVGPIVNEVEMSYQGRNFHDIAIKLLDQQPLAAQSVAKSDSVLSPFVVDGKKGLFDPHDLTKALKYRELIQRAFRKEWWASDKALRDKVAAAKAAFEKELEKADANLKASIKELMKDKAFAAQKVLLALTATQDKKHFALLSKAEVWNRFEEEIMPLRLSDVDQDTANERLAIDENIAKMTGEPAPVDDLMVNNFSLYWGLSIMLYESTLISNDSPFDEMMRGKAEGVERVFAEKVKLDVITSANNTAVPGEPTTDDDLRKVQLDKLPNRNAPPVLTATAMFQRGFRVFMLNCAECHEPPFFTSAADLELAPELPEPIAKLHAHALIRTSLADAFKERLLSSGQGPGVGVNDSNRKFLGDRRFFFDQERIPELEQAVGELMIENMGIDDKRPISFTTAGLPGFPPPDRIPMITWLGTRPPLEFAPSPELRAKPLDPYAFYDLGFYALGVSEPRYDWGVWGFSDESFFFTEQEINQAESLALATSPSLQEGSINKAANKLKAIVQELEGKASPRASLPNLGSAYRLQKSRARVERATKWMKKEAQANALAPQAQPAAALEGQPAPAPEASILPVDFSKERSFLGLQNEPRSDVHFFKRARRMVMTEESWGHRKPFISDNELMGWGAFKTPSLRNVALTEPYMHNGRFLTLRQVLRFYSFDNPGLIPANPQLNPDLHPEMGRLLLNSDGLVEGLPGFPINLTQVQDAEALLFFLHCLTDERVEKQKAPFDHPSIVLVNGFDDSDPTKENSIDLAEVGADGTSTTPDQFPSNK